MTEANTKTYVIYGRDGAKGEGAKKDEATEGRGQKRYNDEWYDEQRAKAIVDRGEWQTTPVTKMKKELASNRVRFHYNRSRTRHQQCLQLGALETVFIVYQGSYEYKCDYKALIREHEQLVWACFSSHNYVKKAEADYLLYMKAKEVIDYGPAGEGPKQGEDYLEICDQVEASRKTLLLEREKQKLAIENLQSHYEELKKDAEALDFWKWWINYTNESTSQWLTDFPFQLKQDPSQTERCAQAIEHAGYLKAGTYSVAPLHSYTVAPLHTV